MDRTSEPTSKSSNEEDSYSVCQSQSGRIWVTARSNQMYTSAAIQSSTGLIISRRSPLLLSGSVGRSIATGIYESSNLTLSYIIEHIRRICFASQNASTGGACPRPSLSYIFRQHLPLSQFLPRLPRILHSSLLPATGSVTTSASSPPRLSQGHTTSDEMGVQDEFDPDLTRHQFEESVLHVLRLLDSLLEGSHSLLISRADNGLNFRLASEEPRNNPFYSQSLMFYITETRDHYRDMRLDVDNMSYEELLALEENIGYVSTGLSEEALTEALKHSKYFLFAEENAQKESCSICQEDFVEEDELGTLGCGHGFHTACIKQWLRCKNLCPVCKSTGLCTMGLSLKQIHNL